MSDVSRSELEALKAKISAIELDRKESLPLALSLDHGIIDRTLKGGLQLGCLHEISGTASDGFAAMLTARFTTPLKTPVLWCVNSRYARHPFAPGLAGMGVSTQRLTIAHCKTPRDMLWAMEEGLKSGAAKLVIGEPSKALGLTESRRLQLTASTSGSIGLILGQHNLALNASTTRWSVSAIPSFFIDAPWGCVWRLELTRSRNGGAGTWDVIWKGTSHEKTHRLCLVSEISDRQTRAA
jgi:protein ImuA